MSLVLNEEQVFLKDSAKKFASEKPLLLIFVKSEIVKLKTVTMIKFGRKWYHSVGLVF